MNHPPMILTVKLVAAVPIGVLANLLGGFDAWLGALIGFTAADIATGIAKGVMTKTLNSKAMWRGGIRKTLIFVVVGIAVELDGLVLHEHALRLCTIAYYIANEGLSVLENIAQCGVPFPKKLQDVLEQIKKTGDTEEREDEPS